MIVANRLESYAYITIALAPAARDKVFAIRDKVPFLRDAILREVNKASIVKSDDPNTVDAAALKARLMVQINRILPPGTVADLKFEQIVLTPVQPPS
jgi:flagellar basal body-associated protein FliL